MLSTVSKLTLHCEKLWEVTNEKEAAFSCCEYEIKQKLTEENEKFSCEIN